MAKAKKLKSGNWRVLVYDYTDPSGKRHYESITAGTKKEAEYLAAEFALNKKQKNHNDITYGQALDEYINNRSLVLSQSTIREYKHSRNRDLQGLVNVPICNITQDLIQFEINKEAESHSPKSVRNMHGLLSAVFKVYRPEMALNTSLPQKSPVKLYIPTDDEVIKLISFVDNDEDMLIAILLAAFGPMRRSEICALESAHINGNIIHVESAMVLDENNKWVIKKTKSYAGDRYIPIPDFVLEKINAKTQKGRIVNISPAQVSDRFIKIQKATGLPHFRFHDLRHYCASIQHAIGIPDAYIMQRGGWGSDAVLKQVYRHALSDEAKKMNGIANQHFSKMQHKMQHE